MMTRIVTFLMLVFTWQAQTSFANAKSWTATELKKANTGENCAFLSEVEKDAVEFLNLARLYPKKFCRLEILTKFGGSYAKSLVAHLNSIRPMHALTVDEKLSESARCFAKEKGEAGTRGHNRINCPKNYHAECCSYGESTGKGIILQFLLDRGVPSLGHRKACLRASFKRLGVAAGPHLNSGYCCVLELKS